MIRRLLVCVVLGLAVFWASAADAQRQSTQWLNAVLRNSIRITVVSGRITNTTGWAFGNRTHRYQSGAAKEEISFQGNGATGSVHCERTNAEEQFTMELASDGRFSIHRTPKNGSTALPIQFVQAPGEPISLTVGPEGKQTVYRASTLWHLLLTQREPCRQHLLPTLETVPGCEQIATTATAVESELLKAANTGKLPDRQHWNDLVQQLGDNQFAKREAADRLLRAVGPSLLCYLEQLDYGQLDAEQQFRVRRIQESLRGQAVGDTPEHVAAQLVADPLVWLALLDRPEGSTRRVAAKQLAGLLGEPIGIDPAADPASQSSQREQLRAKLEPPKPETKTAPKP